MPRYNEYAVQRVIDRIRPITNHWVDTDKDWVFTPPAAERFLKQLAEASLDAVDSLYESEAEESVEYAGIEGGL